jgi:hypothetical protein
VNRFDSSLCRQIIKSVSKLRRAGAGSRWSDIFGEVFGLFCNQQHAVDQLGMVNAYDAYDILSCSWKTIMV